MSIIIGIFLTLLIFTIVVFIHEMGHFLTARMTGMKVEEFGIGIPPKAKKLFEDKHGTTYTLNWLPIGGFVRIKGEDPASEEADDKNSFSHKKWWARSLVLIAGVTMNFILAFVIFFVLFLIGTSPIAPNFLAVKDYQSYFLPSFDDAVASGYVTHSGLTLTSLSGSIAKKAGIAEDELLVSLNDKKISDIRSFRDEVDATEKLVLVLSNSGVSRTVELVPAMSPDGDKRIGVALWYKNMNTDDAYAPKFSAIESARMAAWETYTLSRFTLDMLGQTVKKLFFPVRPNDRKEASEMLAGPIGMGAGMTDMVASGMTVSFFFLIVATISLNLWVLNILPFPALDGGRLVSTSIASFVGLFTKKKSLLVKLEGWFHVFGMILLLAASLAIALMDVWKIVK